MYDGAGSIAKIGGDVFLYDPAGRLKEGSANDSWPRKQTYAYDAFGNMTSKTTYTNGYPIGVSLPTDARNRLTGTAYDFAGNLTSRGGVNYGYDALSSMISLSDNMGTRDWVYVYTPDEEKIWSYDLMNERSYWTLRDLDGKVLREWTNDSSLGYENWYWSRDWIWRGDALMAAETPSYGRVHVTVDHLGSPRLFTNGNGQKLFAQKFFPFGDETGTFTEERLRFTGHERASAYELYGAPAPLDYMHARWYSPEIGRFLSPDPIGTAGGPEDPDSADGN